MAEMKKVTVIKGGGGASVQAELIPGETVQQFCKAVAPNLGLPEDGDLQILTADGKPITGDLYKSAKDGDELTLAHITKGG